VFVIPKNNAQTGKKAASAAAKTLTDAKAPKAAKKSAAGSALSQAPQSHGVTSKKAATAAGKTLADPKASKAEKSVAASALAQASRAKKKK